MKQSIVKKVPGVFDAPGAAAGEGTGMPKTDG